MADIFDIIYQDDDKLVVNKPAGLSVQGGSGVKTALDELLCSSLDGSVFPVHRLDKDTAGIMVFAKTATAAAALSREFTLGKVKKVYAALAVRKGANLHHFPEKGSFTSPVYVDGKQKDALTHYTILEKVLLEQADIEQNIEAAFFSLVLGTGRKHQIRIHLAKAGFPVAADDKYGDFALNKILQKKLGIKKLQLAAVSLDIPGHGHFSVPLPAHIVEACAKIGLSGHSQWQ